LTSTTGCSNIESSYPNPERREATMEKDENREPQEDDAEGTDDLEVGGEEAEGVAGGLRSTNPELGQRA
jgi:hypothetical protein